MKRSRFSDSQIIAILMLAQAGSPVPGLSREHGTAQRRFTNGALAMATWMPR
jgi:putative transposase